jgi:inhibitor of KinA
MEKDPRILPAGDQAVLLEFGNAIDPEMNRRVQSLVRTAREERIPGIGELVPSYCTLLIYYDPLLLSLSDVTAWIRSLLSGALNEAEEFRPTKEIPVLYGGPYGPDISFVARHNGISEEEVIRIHTRETYLVYVVGFVPGFAYMGTVPEKIRVPRLLNPRTKVPAGTVGIAGMQTGIYALESPGGWQLVGQTPLTLFDLGKNPPSFFEAGDRVRFYPISEQEFGKLKREGG